jgi:hypothetical protein
MNIQQISGIVISAGFVLYIAAMLVAPRLYQEPVIANRLAIIAANQTRWNLSQLLFALGPGIPAIGFLLLAFSQRGVPSGWLFWMGAVAFAGGSGFGMWLVYRQTLDPAAFWEGAQIPMIIGYGFLALTLAGMLGLGIAMLQAGFPNWSGYLIAGSAVVLLIITLVTRAESGFFISVLAYVVTFVAGIVVWRQ